MLSVCGTNRDTMKPLLSLRLLVAATKMFHPIKFGFSCGCNVH